METRTNLIEEHLGLAQVISVDYLIVAMMLKSTIPGSQRVRVHKGDGGVDVYEGTKTLE